MNKILSIVGPTATGKTSLALKKAQKILDSKKASGIDLISADSRQVYKGLEIITGADVPHRFSAFDKRLGGKNYKTWENKDQTISLHGVSIIKPDQKWSLGHFQKFAQKIIKESWKNNCLPIVVGGTGLYHQHLLDSSEQIKVKPNKKIRQKSEKMTMTELQNWLKKLNPGHLKKMNNSDKNNPRRLIRAIEIYLDRNNLTPTQHHSFPHAEISTIGITDSLENIKIKIEKRVEDRFKNGAIDEVKNLYKNYPLLAKYPEKSPAFSATGVREIWALTNQEINQNECLKKWALREFQYAKRQLTWWKNKQNITWINL